MTASRQLTERSADRILVTRLAILQFLFDGNPRAWLEFIETEGSPAQRREDLPFVRELVRWCGPHGKEA